MEKNSRGKLSYAVPRIEVYVMEQERPLLKSSLGGGHNDGGGDPGDNISEAKEFHMMDYDESWGGEMWE